MTIQLSSRKLFFTLILASVSVVLTLAGAEAFFRLRERYIQRQFLDDGLILYDQTLGWKLSPNWSGRHRHYDFEVVYTTNQYGFRGDWHDERKRAGRTYGFVGDSFVFSFGVDDRQTFIYQLNAEDSTNAYLNFGVPGYSTDQEYLLIRNRLLYFSPDVLILVVYLGNDLFDNELAFPLQAERGKPYFELTASGLRLQNTPVPLQTKPHGQYQKDLRRFLHEDHQVPKTPWLRFLERFQLFRAISALGDRYENLDATFEVQFQDTMTLFLAIVEATQSACTENDVQLALMTMPGRSFVERPDSYSARLQDYFRRQIVERVPPELPVFDLAAELLAEYRSRRVGLFFPNEGHLNGQGHQVVARQVSSYLALLQQR